MSVLLTLMAASTGSGLACQLAESESGDGDKADIYGEDDRQELYGFSEGGIVRESAGAVAALVRLSEPHEPGAPLKLPQPKTLAEQQGLCDGVAFATQSAISQCTAFWVGEDVMVTAGHCMQANPCSRLTAFVFDYYLDGPEDRRFSSDVEFPGDDVYVCDEVLYRARGGCGNDFAILRVGRSVVGRTPARLPERGHAIEEGAALYMIGHPSGLPAKVTANANLDDLDGTTLSYELDTFGGNSGAPIFSLDGVVRAIHTCGDYADYTADPGLGNDYAHLADGVCKVPTECDHFCLGSSRGMDLASLSDEIEDALARE